jgi:hypothetical protein
VIARSAAKMEVKMAVFDGRHFDGSRFICTILRPIPWAVEQGPGFASFTLHYPE